MSEPVTLDPATAVVPTLGPAGRVLFNVCKVLAIIGGLIFVGLVVMSIASIVGRKVASTPVEGDVEILQMCAAFASSAFFAYCHMNHGDVRVDFFTHNLPPRQVLTLDAIGSTLLGLVGLLIAWRTGVGALSLKEAGETSAILNWPVWIAQMLMVPGFVLLGVAGLYMAYACLRSRKEHAL